MQSNISVLVCVHYQTDINLFIRSVDSLKRQTLHNYEVVFHFDGPVPSALSSYIEYLPTEFPDRISLVLSSSHTCEGHGLSRQRAVDASSGDILVIHDSDDLSHPDRLRIIQNLFIQDPTLDIHSSSVIESDLFLNRYLSTKHVPTTREAILKAALYKCPLNHNSCAIRRSTLLKKGGYIPWHCNEDYFLWIRLLLQSPSCNVVTSSFPLVVAHRSLASSSRRGGILYFSAEAAIVLYMHSLSLISTLQLLTSLTTRFIVQVLLPNRLRFLLYSFYRSIS